MSISTNLGTISKLQDPEELHKASSILSIQKY